MPAIANEDPIMKTLQPDEPGGGPALCDLRTLQSGTNTDEVQRLCGKPFRKFAKIFEGNPFVSKQTWLYDGWNYLQFENDKLVRMDLRNKDGKMK